VAFAVRQLVSPGATYTNFSTLTIPTKVEVDWFIDQIASEIEMAFSEAGYVVPFTVWSTESWPAHQTSLLKFLNVLGVAAIVCDAMRPAPSMPSGREYDQANVYSKRFDDLLDKARAGRLRFRADTYIGTPAHKSLQEARAPMTDFGEGYIDGADHLGIRDFTLLRMAVGESWAAWGGASDIEGYDWDTLRAWGQR
jgi:hypothetical protein